MRYHFRIHSSSSGFWADCIEIPGCVSEGGSIEELKANLQEALDGILDEPAGSGRIFPLPVILEQSDDIIEIPVSPPVAFSMLLRHARLNRKMSQQDAQKALGFKSRNSYARLEHNANPSLLTIVKIKEVFPELPVEESFA